MSTDGIEAVYVETRSWADSVRFFQALGYAVEFETDHHSGMLRHGEGPYLFLAEVAGDQPVEMQIILHAGDAATFALDPSIEVVEPFTATHWGTRRMVVRDPDGRPWNIEAPDRE